MPRREESSGLPGPEKLVGLSFLKQNKKMKKIKINILENHWHGQVETQPQEERHEERQHPVKITLR